MSFKRKCKNPTTIILEDIKHILSKKYHCLSINQSITQDHVLFLHIWKPITQSEGVQGMPFLPCFHIIVTVTGVDDHLVEKDSSHAFNEHQDSPSILFQLHSFHGKVIADESIILEKCNQDTNFDLVQRMAEDRIQMCHGIEEVNKDKFTNFLASCELPLLGKIKSVFLIEQFMGEIVLRSRLCEFALYDGLSTMESFARCQECDAFERDDHEFDPLMKSSLKSEQSYAATADNENSGLKPDNMYERVYQQTTVSDGETMAVLDQAKNLYDISGTDLFTARKLKRKAKRNTNISKLDPLKAFVEIKSEPGEAINDDESALNLPSDTNEMVGDNTLFNDTVPALTREDNVLQCGDGQRNVNDEPETVFEGYSCKMEGGIDNPSPIHSKNPQSKRRKRLNPDMYDSYNSVHKSKPTRRKYKKKELTEEQKIAKLEKVEKRKLDAKKRLVTYSRTCSICSHTFTNITHYDQDQTRHAQALADLNQPFLCPLCNITIETKFLVTEHFAKEHADLNVTCCCECTQVIPNGNNRLRRHILKFHHSAEEKVVCPECGKESSGKTQLEIHLAQYHSDKKIAVCQTCGKGFGTMSHYQLHLRRHHQPRDLQCPHCDKKFESRDQAIKHLIVHTQIKPFKCIQCPYVSYRASNVYCVHYEKSHGRKGNNDDVITDIVERDRMFEIARIEAEQMLQERNSKLKKEPRPDSIFMRTWGRKISTKPETQENS